MNDNCIFCKIGNGQIPAKTIYEDDMFRVILDVNPATRGHALIIPKAHYENLLDLDDSVAKNILSLAKKIGATILETLKCDGFNLVQNNGLAAGQTVFHFHMHVIPRYKEEQAAIVAWNPGTVSEEQLEELASLLQIR